MDKTTEHYTRLVKRIFGEDCRVQTSSGTRIKAGSVTIYLADRIIGQAESFQEALREAMRTVSQDAHELIVITEAIEEVRRKRGIAVQSCREKANEPTRGLTLGPAFGVGAVCGRPEGA